MQQTNGLDGRILEAFEVWISRKMQKSAGMIKSLMRKFLKV